MATPAQLTALRNLMGTLLMSGAAQRINFFLGGFHVDGSGFSFIALALLSKPSRGHGISIRVNANQPKGVAAQYHHPNDTIEFPSATYGTTAGTTGQLERLTIIHECVHAVRDAQGKAHAGLTDTLALSEEAAAYLAGALFHIFATTAPGAAPTTPPWALTGPNAPVFAAAHTLALGVRTTMGLTVTPASAAPLRAAILANPAYGLIKSNPGMFYGYNGINL